MAIKQKEPFSLKKKNRKKITHLTIVYFLLDVFVSFSSLCIKNNHINREQREKEQNSLKEANFQE